MINIYRLFLADQNQMTLLRKSHNDTSRYVDHILMCVNRIE